MEDWNYKISLLHIDDTGFDYDPETISQDANGMKKSFINLSGKSKSFGLFGNDEVNAEVKYQYLTEDKSRPTARVPGQGSIIKYLSEVEQNQFDLSLNTDVFNDEQHKIQQGSLQLNGRYINHQEVSGQTSGIRDTEINIPFTPINSDKIFSSTLHIEDLFTALTLHCQQKDINSWHILYCNEVNTALPNDVYQRNTVQFHWFNRDYQSFDNFLHSFTSRKRKNTRKERLSISQQGLKTRQLKGNKITPKDIDFFYLTYQLTYLKRGHQPHLSFNFFKQIFNRMSENILLIIASDEKEDVACALFLYNNSHLYGRYWGCTKAYSNLHFELCYYLGIEFCIKNKISTFNPGTQGEHKIKRGFEPVLTHSYHWIKHPTFKEPIKNFCKQEQQHMLTYQQQCQQLLPFKK